MELKYLLVGLFYYNFVYGSKNRTFKSFNQDIFKNNNVVVWFDPFVSFQDIFKLTEYNETSLTPLLRKVSSRFSSIMVHMTEDELDALGWQYVTAIAVAKLNAMINNNSSSFKPTLRVWISFHYLRAPKDDSPEYDYHLSLLTKMSQEANAIFPGSLYALTVHMANQLQSDGKELLKRYKTILRTLHRHRASLQAQERYFIGVMFDIANCHITSALSIKLLKLVKDLAEIVFFDALSAGSHLSLLNKNDEVFHWFRGKISQCKHALESVPSKNILRHIRVLAGLPDTATNGDVNYFGLVQFWQSLTFYAEESSTVVILDRAFDTPHLTEVSKATNGWWRLKEDRMNENPSQYVFEEKQELAKQAAQMLNLNENINQTWANMSTKFNTKHVGVWGFPLLFNEVSYNGSEINKLLLRKISENFHKVMVGPVNLAQEYKLTSTFMEVLMLAAEHNTRNMQKIEIILVFDIPADYLKFSWNDLEIMKQQADKANLIYPNSTKLMLFNYGNIVESTFHVSNNAIQNYITNNGTDFQYEYGLILPLDIWCLQEANLTDSFANSWASMSTLALTAEVIWPNLVKGVERYLRKFSILLERCQNRIKSEIFDAKNYSVDLVFILNWNGIYYEDTEIYKLADFVAFWEGLNDWAFKQHATIILGQAFDSGDLENGTLKRDGWWIPTKNEPGTSNIEPFSFEDKKSVILRLLSQEKDVIQHTQLSTSALGTLQILWISVGVVIVLILNLIIQQYVWRKYQLYQHISRNDLQKFFKGVQVRREAIEKCVESNKDNFSHQHVPYEKHVYEIKRSQFSIGNDENAYLGNGELGIVQKGKIFRVTGEVVRVAVKAGKNPPKKDSLLSLLAEIKTLSYIGQHPNIVKLVGAYTAELHKGIVYVFLEYCHLGSLENHMRGLGQDLITVPQNIDDKNKSQASTLDLVVFADFSRWASEIVAGMVYLASKDVVHADLAARNILLTIDKKAKIADFGLSRRMYNYKCYVKSGEELLPWRWMAPESLRFLKFTEKSDIWSFGVLLWEVYSLGETPYPGVIWNTDFANGLEEGLRLCEPSFNTNYMYSLMLKCWHTNPVLRPSFIDVQAILDLCKDHCHEQGWKMPKHNNVYHYV